MGMVVQHNLTSMNANRNLGVSCGALAKSTEKLSSGYKINRAGDNAAGLAISEKMRGQIRGLNQASANSEDGISMIQTAEGALTETHSIIQRMRELAVQAASDTNTDDDRTQIQNEIDQLTQEVDRIATTTEFNTKKLLDGSRTGSVTEKAGKASVEGTFGNSNVSAEITTNGADKAAFTDVIRVEITKDFAGGYSNVDAASVNGYENLAKDLATSNAAVDKLQNFAAYTGKLTDTLVSNYINATKDVLAGKGEAHTAQSAAWNAIMGSGVGALAATGESVELNGNTHGASAAATAVLPDLKAELDEIAKMEVEMETNETYQEIGAIEVDDIENAGDTKKLSDIISDKTARDADYTTAYTKATNGGGWELSANGVDAAASAYKTALKKALESGKSIDDAKQDEKVVEAREALYAVFKTDLSGASTSVTAAAIKIGNTDFTAGSKKSDVAAEAFDYICETAEKLAATEVMSDEAFNIAKGDVSFEVKDLFGNSEDKANFEIASGLDAKNNLKITLKNKEGEDTVITIANADKLLAGDVITITSEKMTETKSAATGKEAFRLQVGANAGQEVSLGINSMKAKDLDIVQTKGDKVGKALDVTSQATASLAVNAYDMAIQKVSTERAKMGAMQNRLEHTIANLDTSAENLQSAESSLRDTDMAEEMTQFSKNNILMQAGQSMLAQANQSNQGVLSLLQ